MDISIQTDTLIKRWKMYSSLTFVHSVCPWLSTWRCCQKPAQLTQPQHVLNKYTNPSIIKEGVQTLIDITIIHRFLSTVRIHLYPKMLSKPAQLKQPQNVLRYTNPSRRSEINIIHRSVSTVRIHLLPEMLSKPAQLTQPQMYLTNTQAHNLHNHKCT